MDTIAHLPHADHPVDSPVVQNTGGPGRYTVPLPQHTEISAIVAWPKLLYTMAPDDMVTAPCRTQQVGKLDSKHHM
jgi:hypothetical protein